MAQHKQQRWILVGGLGLTASLWLLHSLGAGLSQWSEGISLPLLVLMVGGWWWQRRSLPTSSPRPPLHPYDRAVVEREWAIVDTQIAQLQVELPEPEHSALESYHSQRQALETDLQRQNLSLAITGSAQTGKTTLVELLQLPLQSTLESTLGSPLQSPWPHALEEVPLTETPTLLAHDAILVLTNGDLTQSELNALLPLAAHPGVVVAVNKQDQYLPDPLAIVVAQVESHLQEHLPQHPIPVVTIASRPGPIQRRKMAADGTWQEQWQQPEPNLAALLPQLQRLQDNASTLICATTYRQSQALKHRLHSHLNQLRQQEALKIIQKAQGIAAIAAGVNPIPSLDLLATLAVNAQLLVDLARLYHQPLSLKDGEIVAKTLAALLVKLGLVELATQVVAPLLKAHQVTYVAGAVLQGISAAYLTRVAGLAIVEYLASVEPGTQLNSTDWRDVPHRFSQILKATFQRLQNQDCRQWLSQAVQSVAGLAGG